MVQGIEKRKSHRADLELDIDLGLYGEYALSKLVNMSIGGAFVRSRVLQPVGTKLKLRFELPDDPKPIEAEGEVMWSYDQRGQTNHNASGMGIQFTQILQSDRDRIKSFISEFLSKPESSIE